MSRAPSRASSIADSPSVTTSSNAAIVGAAAAFSRPNLRNVTASQAPSLSVVGALSASGHGPSRSRSPISPNADTSKSRHGSTDNGFKSNPSSGSRLDPPVSPRRAHSRSPSHYAASVAAARANPVTMTGREPADARPRVKTVKRPSAPPKPRRLSAQLSREVNEGAEKPTDDTSIPPTTSLVDLFERKASLLRLPPGKRSPPEPIVVAPRSDLPLKSPVPMRTSGGFTTMLQLELDGANEKAGPQISPPRSQSPPSKPESTAWDPNTRSFRPQSEVQQIQKETSVAEEKRAETSSNGISPPLLDRNKIAASNLAVPHRRVLSSVDRDATKSPYRPAKSEIGPSPSDASTTDPVKALRNSFRPDTEASDGHSPSSYPSAASVTAQYHQLYTRKLTPSMTGDQLANAMVASSLASSRTNSPWRPHGKLEPPPPPTRRHKHMLSFSRTPSPAAKTGMLQTLRKKESDSSESDDDLHPYSKHKRDKHRIVRKHPNKHHEGDRKRWREAVTERERKRYEGVWAANKGQLSSFTYEEQRLIDSSPDDPQSQELLLLAQDQVSNLATREVWSRSRLPQDTLEMVWDLVDNDRVGRLSKQEFVVGLWLIDQRLKGRKLPVKVSDSVWASVRTLQGIKIRKSIR